jgi:hypothetical protein
MSWSLLSFDEKVSLEIIGIDGISTAILGVALLRARVCAIAGWGVSKRSNSPGKRRNSQPRLLNNKGLSRLQG